MSTLSLFPDDAQAAERSASRKAELGQFMTPPHVAALMASWFEIRPGAPVSLLDPGAGQGALTAAFLAHAPADLSVRGAAVEVDPAMRGALVPRLSGTGVEVVAADFIEWGTDRIRRRRRGVTHAILNPPYRKLGNGTAHDRQLRRVGIESPNLYAAFVSVSLELLDDGGQIVALVPRSFCNGTYYRPFREHLMRRASIDRIHLFDSRDATFKAESVLQENVVVKLTRGAAQGDVVVSHSTDDGLADLSLRTVAFDEVVPDPAGGRFIHVPTEAPGGLALLRGADQTLGEIGLSVSTGPVVDFRVRDHLRASPDASTVPLIYPQHFDGLAVRWPQQGAKKPNALALNSVTRKSTYAPGTYCVVRRLSSKEEKRRVVACVVTPEALGGPERLAFENHVNVFHIRKAGLPPTVARGLAIYLSSTAFDASFRRFNGHTQVNVGDLKHMRYPSLDALNALGRLAPAERHLSQDAIDGALLRVLR